MDEFWQFYEQWVRFNERDAKLNGGQGVASIVDFEGFELNHGASRYGETNPTCYHFFKGTTL